MPPKFPKLLRRPARIIPAAAIAVLITSGATEHVGSEERIVDNFLASLTPYHVEVSDIPPNGAVDQ